jgi:hypothetical protein
MNTEKTSLENESQPSCLGAVSGSALRTYAEHCPNCGTTAKIDTKKYCSDECKIEYKARLDRKFR